MIEKLDFKESGDLDYGHDVPFDSLLMARTKQCKRRKDILHNFITYKRAWPRFQSPLSSESPFLLHNMFSQNIKCH